MAHPLPILIMNGPNLGFIGQRQPEIYGSRTLDDLPAMLATVMGNRADQISLSFFQSNSQGALIDRLEQAWQDKTAGIVLNAGAYTHTSLALADCLAWIKIPCIEVHISNVHARSNPLRHTSLMAPSCIGVIAGLGIMGYVYGVQALFYHIHQRAQCSADSRQA
ncbi:type II 3-dehydroquinate dehydratase [Desulfoplanes formicivorans]|uniref:3-dehydroquinate dehydratase n=1 Tax=Desulfoplanes formicivorans TaxID=1592317 RepID=A0A194AFS6_9BACT|nr:type II 3-dehydroquinate dehydratase [Desulfoplanes formicivorans]GAU08183.1 3-dehydroquinate dehydratase [Desulfoplanes formicivorans]